MTIELYLLNLVKRLAQGLALLIAAVGLYLAYSIYTTTYRYNYKLTLEVEADGKVYSGSSVISVTANDNHKALWVYPGWSTSAWGGSPWVDLGERGIVFVSIEPTVYQVSPGEYRPFSGVALPFAAFFGAKPPLRGQINVANLTQMPTIRTRGEVSPRLAQLMWMPAANKPGFAEFFPPNDQDELEKRGIKVRGIYVEITNERADYDAIFDKFPWLKIMSQTTPLKHKIPNGLNARTLLGDYK